MPEKTEVDEITEVLVDIDRDIIIGAIKSFAQHNLSGVSASIVEEAITRADDYETPLSYMLERLGRAIFNDIIAVSLRQMMDEEIEEGGDADTSEGSD